MTQVNNINPWWWDDAFTVAGRIRCLRRVAKRKLLVFVSIMAVALLAIGVEWFHIESASNSDSSELLIHNEPASNSVSSELPIHTESASNSELVLDSDDVDDSTMQMWTSVLLEWRKLNKDLRLLSDKDSNGADDTSFSEPGQCYPLNGSTASVQFRLSDFIMLEAVTLEHSVAYNRSTAPKDCKVYGWLEESSFVIKKERVLAEFTYDIEKSNAQTFNVSPPYYGLINMVRFDFTSNHGSPSHTCIHRFEVQGA